MSKTKTKQTNPTERNETMIMHPRNRKAIMALAFRTKRYMTEAKVSVQEANDKMLTEDRRLRRAIEEIVTQMHSDGIVRDDADMTKATKLINAFRDYYFDM